jgi:ribosomal-protein-alanine N-acetyltransferase
MKIIESERLRLRPFTLRDSDFIVELLNTEGWIKYIGDRNVKTTEEAKKYLLNGPMKSYEINGFGLSLVELKTTETPIGMSGLLKRDYLEHPDIGFAFLPGYMGKGYAYEMVKEMINHYLYEMKIEKIMAITLPGNFSSIKLLEKLGFSYEKKIISQDTNEQLSLYSTNKST